MPRDAKEKARAEVKRAQSKFAHIDSERDQARIARREAFERARAVGLTLREIGEAADYLVAVACAGFVVIKETYGPDHLDLWTDLIWFGRDVIDEFVSEAGELPPLDGPPSISLGRRLIEARSEPSGT